MKDILDKFFKSHPAVSKQKFCREAGITPRSLYYYMNGERKPKKNTQANIKRVMVKYGN